MRRLFANILVLMSIAVLPWWLAIMLILLMLVYFDFIEIMFYGMVMDVLYSRSDSYLSSHVFFVSAVFIYAVIILVKPYLRNVGQ